MEREGAHTHTVERMAARLYHMDRLVHRGRGRAIVDHTVFGRFCSPGNQRSRNEILGGVELADQPLHVVDVWCAFLGVARVAVARGAASEERALGRMRAGISPEGDAVAIDVEIAPELLTCFELLCSPHLAAREF